MAFFKGDWVKQTCREPMTGQVIWTGRESSLGYTLRVCWRHPTLGALISWEHPDDLVITPAPTHQPQPSERVEYDADGEEG